MRSTDFPFAVMPQRLQRGGRPDYSAPSADVADLLDPSGIVGRGRLEARETSWRDKLKDELAVRFGRRNAEQLLTLADFTPLAGAFVGNEAALAVRKGKRGEAAANVALAALPIPGAAKKGIKAAAKGAKSLAVKPRGITAYHGSPHSFDRFDMSKIGTGEGAQAYGHGLYFAENEDVARSYRDSLAGRTSNPLDRRGVDPAYPAAAADILKSGKSPDETVAILSQIYKRATESQLRAAVEMANPGAMYQVRINADPADFLDYDAPLSGQSEKVQAALGSSNLLPQFRAAVESKMMALRDAVKQQGRAPNEQEKAAMSDLSKRRFDLMQQGGKSFAPTTPEEVAALAEAGIPGIKYLDQGSRATGDGSRNFVVFDDKLISILKKYGWAPGMAIPAAAMAEYEAEQELARGGFAVKKGR